MSRVAALGAVPMVGHQRLVEMVGRVAVSATTDVSGGPLVRVWRGHPVRVMTEANT